MLSSLLKQLAVLLLSVLPVVSAAESGGDGWEWIEAKDFGVEGRPFESGCDAPYARIPAGLRGRIPDETYDLGRMCAGMCLRFAVDDDRVRLRCEVEPATWKFVPTDLYMDEMLPPDTDLTLDLCHPNDAGARILAESYAKKVKDIFKEKK